MGSRSPTASGTFERDDARIFPHAANHRSQWPWCHDFSACCQPAFRLASCRSSRHIKFSQWKILPPAMWPLVLSLWLFVLLCLVLVWVTIFNYFFHKGSPCNGLIFETGLIIISVILKFTFTLVLYFVLAEPEQMSVLYLIAECYSNITPKHPDVCKLFLIVWYKSWL